MKPTGITPVLLKGSVPDAAPLPETPLKQEHEPRRPSAQLRDLPSRKKASQAVGSEEPRSPVSRTRIVDAAQREFVAAQIYKAQVMYHATTSHSKESIQKGGFSAHRKSGGATAELMGQVAMSEQFNQNAKTHHYAFTDVENAKAFQKSNLRTAGPPAIVRFFKEHTSFERDPDFSLPAARRTSADIPARQILKSRQSPPTAEEGEMMRRALAHEGIEVNQSEAGRLLREVQSDSEDDFAETQTDRKKPFWQETREGNVDLSREAFLKKRNA